MPTPITKKNYETLQAELVRLRKIKHPKVIEAIAETKTHNDLNENAEYDAAKERQGFIESRISELEGKIADARIVEINGRTSETIVFGATVLVVEQESQSKKQYTLVGQDEADMKFNKISVQSPVGRALIGKRVGDFVEVKTPVKMVEYEVVEIKFEEC
ncbi:MAG: transcription elongation factor GreA [Nitrospira sp.]|nr:transcription elongation factor GreA [Nitrospira sp.]